MVNVSITQLAGDLPGYLRRVREAGEVVRVVESGHSVAEIHPPADDTVAVRKIGLAKGQFAVPDAFFLPLPDDLVQAFEGE